MATNEKNQNQNQNEYDFIGVPIEYLITEPLLAVTKAQNSMAREQLKLVLDMCFNFNGNTYEPKVINMTLTRAVIEPDAASGAPQIEQIVTQFSLPIISIFPINTLGLDTVNIAFGIDVLNQYTIKNAEGQGSDSTQSQLSSEQGKPYSTSRVDIWGRVSPKGSNQAQANFSEDNSSSSSDSFDYSVDVVASPLPLTKGMLSIIDLYTKAIEPIEMPTEKND